MVEADCLPGNIQKYLYMSGTAIRVLALLLTNWTVQFTCINCPWCLAQLLKHQLLCALIGWDTPVLNCFNLRLLWLYYCGVPILCRAHRCWGDCGRCWNTTCATVLKQPIQQSAICLHSAIPVIPQLLCKKKVHYHVHISPSLFPVFSLMHPVHIIAHTIILCNLVVPVFSVW